MMTSWFHIIDFFGPIFGVFVFACANVFVDREQPTSLPKYCQIEADFRIWSMNRLTDSPTTFSGGRVHEDHIEVEICPKNILDESQALSPRSQAQINAFA